MVESLFRSLKNNFLYSQKYKTVDDLKRKVGFYFKEHNEVIPQYSLDGALPMEVYAGTWREQKRDNLFQNIQSGVERRIRFNKNAYCCNDSS